MRTIKQKLSSLHYRFENEAAFLKFSDERISRVFFEDDPYNHELRLDYKSIDEPGRLIVRFSTKAEMKCEPSGRVTLTIG
ncbi:MAG TPA: hypothetical protein VEA58_05395 [Anaerovoracaceae bacterium]|nr:hypothetical protein [Anaerovoracaceae bacterium]